MSILSAVVTLVVALAPVITLITEAIIDNVKDKRKSKGEIVRPKEKASLSETKEEIARHQEKALLTKAKAKEEIARPQEKTLLSETKEEIARLKVEKENDNKLGNPSHEKSLQKAVGGFNDVAEKKKFTGRSFENLNMDEKREYVSCLSQRNNIINGNGKDKASSKNNVSSKGKSMKEAVYR